MVICNTDCPKLKTYNFKAINQNVMHSSIDMTDQFYSNQNEKEFRNDKFIGKGKE